MKRWAIAFINFMDNELHIEFHIGAEWGEAARQHSRVNGYEFDFDGTLEDAKQEAFDCDAMIDAVVVPGI